VKIEKVFSGSIGWLDKLVRGEFDEPNDQRLVEQRFYGVQAHNKFASKWEQVSNQAGIGKTCYPS
jgi:hypothetical protein